MVDKEDQKARADLGNNLRDLREKKKMTQAEIAKRADIHVNYYARIERGEENPSFDRLRRIMKSLEIKSSEVMPF